MRIPHIVWAEDEDDQYNACLQSLTDFLTAKGLAVKVTRAINGTEVMGHLTGARDGGAPVDLLICDLVMEGWDGVNTILEIASYWPHLPVVVLSGKLEKPDIRQKVERLKTHGFVRGCYPADPKGEWPSAVWSIIKDKSFAILHISDIHFGPFHAFPQLKLEDLIACADLPMRRLLDVELEAILITGDLTSRGLVAEFDQAIEFISNIRSDFSVALDRVIVVPGNHDIYRKDEPNSRFTKFIDFLENLYEKRDDVLKRYGSLYDCSAGLLNRRPEGSIDDKLYCVADFEELGVTVLGLNSVISENDKLFESSQISSQQLLGAGKALAGVASSHDKRLNIAAFHHHLFETPSLMQPRSVSRALMNQGLVVRSLLERRVQVVLHGHTHYSAAYKHTPYYARGQAHDAASMHVFSAGTVGGADHAAGQSSFSLNLLKFKPGSAEGVVEAEAYPMWMPADGMEWQVGSVVPFQTEI